MVRGSADRTSADNDAFAGLVDAGRRASSAFGGVPLDRRPIAEQVANRIMGMIKSGNLKSGDRLPTEQQMTIAFAISRPPLREALKALTLMGVLESRQGGRYTVTDLTPSRLVAPFNAMLAVAEYDVDQQFEARSVVDLELTRLCARRAPIEQLNRIMKLAVDGRAFENDPVAFRLIDIEFHQAINDGAGNALLASLAQVLYDLGLDVRRTASELPGVINISVAQHVVVAEALMARDEAAAAAAYRKHLEHVRDTTQQSMAIADRS